MNRRRFTDLFLFAAVLAATAGFARAAHAQNADLYVRGAKQHVHGVNQAWFFGRYGTDIGYNPLHRDWGCGYNSGTANAWLADMKRMHINVVRVWLFEDMDGLTFDGSGYVNGVQSTFLSNLDDLVAKANANGLALYLTFLNHNLSNQWGQTLPGGATIKNFVTSGTARDRFVNIAIWTIANRYKNNNGVFGYDLINESNIGTGNGSYSWTDMRSFAQVAAQKIHWEGGSAHNTSQVSMSTQWYAFGDQGNHPSWYGGLGLDFYDYHEYSNSPNLPNKASWLDKPLLLGEHGPANIASADANTQNSASDAYIGEESSRGWAGNLAWQYYSAPGNGENIANNPGANQDWEKLGWTIQWWGANRFGL